jgi:hypothetical protein
MAMMADHTQTILSAAQHETLLELGRRGSGGSFDQQVLSQLFVLELIEVRSADRRLALTERGRQIYKTLSGR